MPRLTDEELCIANLRGEVPKGQLGHMKVSEAHAELVRISGRDLGCEADKWEEFFRLNPKPIHPTASDPMEAVRLSRIRSRKDEINGGT